MPRPDAAVESMIRNLEAETGKTLRQWIALANATNRTKHGEILKALKAKHGLTHGYANLVALRAIGSGSLGSANSDLVATQYRGDKKPLRPLYDAVVAAVKAFGKDVEVSPKKAYVSLRRSKQFAIIQPSTKTRLDVGLNLKGVKPGGRLEASGSFNAMVTHRVRIEHVKDIDRELVGWLKAAYDSA